MYFEGMLKKPISLSLPLVQSMLNMLPGRQCYWIQMKMSGCIILRTVCIPNFSSQATVALRKGEVGCLGRILILDDVYDASITILDEK